jgi:hypothetical protein
MEIHAPLIGAGRLFQRVLFRHWSDVHQGGWFDTSTGNPYVEISRASSDLTIALFQSIHGFLNEAARDIHNHRVHGSIIAAPSPESKTRAR